MDMFEQDLRSLQQPPQRSTECACAWFKHFNHPIILHLQTFFFRVFLHKQQAFSSGNLHPERPTTTITAIKTQVFVFRYQRVNWTRKFTIVAEIVSLLKKIYKWDAPFGAVFKVKNLSCFVSALSPRNENKYRKIYICRHFAVAYFFLWKWCNQFPRSLYRTREA